MSISSPFSLVIALLVLLGLIGTVLVRRPELPRGSILLMLAGGAMLALAAGGASILLPRPRQVVVMVDVSASTRTASYHDRAALDRRIRQLLGETAYQLEVFSSPAAEQTRFAPPALADAVLVFSDARFDLPRQAPPTYVIADPNLDQPADGAIARLEHRGDRVEAAIRNTDPGRGLIINRDEVATIAAGGDVISTRVDPSEPLIIARLSGSDPWPENDSLTLHRAPVDQRQRWWVGASPPSDWMRVELPTDPAAYLSASVIALNNIPADALSSIQQQRLTQYVRDFGGGLLVLGGERGFAAGGYTGSALEALSPLSSAPPAPQRRWVLLADSSGSMASPAGAGAGMRWQLAVDAILRLLPNLPPRDIVSIGSFARDLRWWSRDRSAAVMSNLPPPPPDIRPGGPTNLEAALRSIAKELDGSAQTQVIVISDGDTAIDDPDALAASLAGKNARLHLIATADVAGSPVPRIVSLTGGEVVTEVNPRLWADAARDLLRAAAPDRIERTTVTVRFTGALAALPERQIAAWNRTWLKEGAQEAASALSSGQQVSMGARWPLGAGAVAAFAFPMLPAEISAASALIERRPRDPRFSVHVDAGADLVVTVDAIDRDGAYLNGLEIGVDLTGDSPDAAAQPASAALGQIGPGRYRASMPAPRRPALASLRVDGRIIDRFAIAGRYAREFDRIGNDYESMNRLAQLSDGEVVLPSRNSPIRLRWPKRNISLISPLGCAGAACIAVGLLLWKMR